MKHCPSDAKLLFFILALSAACAADSAAQWPQYQCTPQRQGWAPDRIEPPYRIAWYRNFLPDRLAPAAQCVVGNDRVFIGTKRGVLYALDPATGAEVWTAQLGGAVLHTAGLTGGMVFIGCEDGSVYAFSTDNGALVWKFQSEPGPGHHVGFSAPVLLAGGKILLPRRDGVFFALNQADGSLAWARDLGAPVLQGAAYNDGLVFVGSEDMRMHAISCADGTDAWSTEQVHGVSWGNLCPVIAAGKVFNQVQSVFGRNVYRVWVRNAWGLRDCGPFTWFTEPDTRLAWSHAFAAGVMPDIFERAQDKTIDFYRAAPHSISLHVRDEKTGAGPIVVPHWNVGNMGGPLSPSPALPDGTLVMPVWYAGSAWGRLSLDTLRIVDLLDNMPSEQEAMENPKIFQPGRGNPDETMNLSAGGDIIYAFQIGEGNAQYTGVYDLRTRRWTQVAWNSALPRQDNAHIWGPDIDTLIDANEAGGGSPVSISGKYFYHATYHRVIARTSAGDFPVPDRAEPRTDLVEKVKNQEEIPDNLLERWTRDISGFDPLPVNVPPEAYQAREWTPPEDSAPLDNSWQAESLGMGLKPRRRIGYWSKHEFDGDEKTVHGLAFDVRIGPDSLAPELSMPTAVGTMSYPAGTTWEPSRVADMERRRLLLGTVRIPNIETELASESFDWSRNTLSFETFASDGAQGPGFKLTVSRLTPALLLEIRAPDPLSGAGVELFAGAKPPAMFAFANNGKVATGSLAPSAAHDFDDAISDEGWFLFWHGEESPFFSMPYPYTYVRNAFLSQTGRDNLDFRPADCPILVVGGGNTEVFAQGDSWLIESFPEHDSEVARLVLLPLCGNAHPPVSETRKWETGLPPDVLERCRWWAARLARYPLSVRENYEPCASRETGAVREVFEWVPVRDTGSFMAPLPPMLALARRHGLDMEFSSKVVDPGYVTRFGPAMGIEDADEYTWRVSDLPRYALETRVGPENIEAAPALLRERLEKEVNAMLEAGPMAPLCFVLNDMPLFSEWYFLTTGENLAYLADLLCLLPPESAGRVRAYMAAERAAFPPERCLSLPLFNRARRERWMVDDVLASLFLPDYENRPVFEDRMGYLQTPINKRMPLRELYGLWSGLRADGAELTDDTWQTAKALLVEKAAHHDWASLGWFYGGAEPAGARINIPGHKYPAGSYGGVAAANSYFAGLVGFIRLARMAEDASAEEFAWGLLHRTAAMRFAMGKFAAYLYDSGAIRVPETAEKQPDWMLRQRFDAGFLGQYLWAFEWTRPEHDVRQVLCLDEEGPHLHDHFGHYRTAFLIPFMHMVPELGRFLSDNLQPESDAYFRRVKENRPDWHLALREAMLAGDKQHYPDPTDNQQLFLERAWISRESPDKLARYIDIPRAGTGDYFYMQRLGETIRAYAGTTWERISE